MSYTRTLKVVLLITAIMLLCSCWSTSIFSESIQPRVAGARLFTTGGISIAAGEFVENVDEDFSDEWKQERALELQLEHPNAELLSEATSRYNCHAYAWYNRSEDNVYWIDQSEVHCFVSDPHTVEITNEDDLLVGDIVTYTYYETDDNGESQLVYSHSAVIDAINDDGIICISKWGYDGLYRHHISDVPDDYRSVPNDSTSAFQWKYYRYYQGVHDNGVTATTSTTHTISCTKCDLGTSRRELHSLRYTDVDSSYHLKKCIICNYSETQAHILNNMRNACANCGRPAPFTSVMMIPSLSRNAVADRCDAIFMP